MAAFNKQKPRTCRSPFHNKSPVCLEYSLAIMWTTVLLTLSTWFQICLVFISQCLSVAAPESEGMFRRLPWLDNISTSEPLQRNYGVAAADVDLDGQIEWLVAGFTGPNYVLKYNAELNILQNIAKTNISLKGLLDPKGRAIGVCACDIDGDGREEIYFLNTNDAYAGKSSYGDKLFKYRYGQYVNLFDDEPNRRLDAKNYAGRSVACVDRFGSGKYAIAIATYSDSGTGSLALLEMDESHPYNNVETGYIVLRNAAKDARIDRSTGGRGIVVGPILNNDGRTDVFFGNEGNRHLNNKGENFLFQNLGNGSFVDVAGVVGISDENENVRGVAIADLNHDGLVDIVYGNWEGKHRVFIQEKSSGQTKFRNIAIEAFEEPSLIRTVIVADFDNDRSSDIFFNNIYGMSSVQPNRLFTVKARKDASPLITPLNPGDALEEDGCGTGAGVADIDNDGQLDLLVSHGESSAQPLRVYSVNIGGKNSWIRVVPRTKFGAPARGASVSMETSSGDQQLSVIDGGSGYLCQMEPVAHFGLGKDTPVKLHVTWPDGRRVSRDLTEHDANTVHVIDHPDFVPPTSDIVSSRKVNVTLAKPKTHEEL